MDNSMKSLFDWKKMFVGVLICIAFVGILGTVFAESSQELSTHFIETFGLWGLFVGALLIDSIPTPGGPIPSNIHHHFRFYPTTLLETIHWSESLMKQYPQ